MARKVGTQAAAKGAKHSGGRPREWTAARIRAEGVALLEWFAQGQGHWWLKDFAIERGFPAQYLSKWAEEDEVFREAYARAKDIQESRIVHRAEVSKSPQIHIFALKNVAGWRDTIEHSGDAAKPVVVRHEIDADTAENIYSILAEAGALPTVADDAATDSVDTA